MSVRSVARVDQSTISAPCCVSVTPVNAVAMPPPPVFGSRTGIITVAVAIRVEVAAETAVVLAGDSVAATVTAVTVDVGVPPTKMGVLDGVPTSAIGV